MLSLSSTHSEAPLVRLNLGDAILHLVDDGVGARLVPDAVRCQDEERGERRLFVASKHIARDVHLEQLLVHEGCTGRTRDYGRWEGRLECITIHFNLGVNGPARGSAIVVLVARVHT